MSYNFAYTTNPTLTTSLLGYTISQTSTVNILSGNSNTITFIQTIPIGVYIINVSGYLQCGSQNGWSCFVNKGVSSGTILTSTSSIAVDDTKSTASSFKGLMNIIFVWTNTTPNQPINVRFAQTDNLNESIFLGNISITRIA